MPEQLQKILNQVVDWWKKFNNKQRILLISIVAAVLIALGILAFVVSRPQWVTVYAAKDMAEASKINELLSADSSITFKVVDGGKTFQVDSKNVSQVNYLLADNEIPSAVYGIENVTDGGFSTTEASVQKKYEYYLEQKLSNDLAELFNGIERANVDITPAKDDGTILHGDDEATAAISLNLSDSMTEEQAYGIARLVATALGNSTTEGITILDQNKNILFSGADMDSVSGVISSNLSNKEKQMAIVEKQVKNALSTVYKDINVGLNLSVDYSNKESSTHEFYAPDGQTNGMIGSSSEYNASGNNIDPSEIPGTDTNDDTQYMLYDGAESSFEVSDVDLVYQNNELITKVTDKGGKTNYEESSITVSATRYEMFNEAQLRANGALDEMTYEEYQELNSNPYREDASEEFINAIANATGIDASRITLISYVEPTYLSKEKSSRSVSDILQIVLAVLILLLLGYVVFRSTRKPAEAEMEPELSVETLLEATAEQEEEALENIGYSEKSETRLLIEKFVDENPEATALLLRNWLNDDWE